VHDLAGVLLGLTAALTWGLTDVAAMVASRRVGSLAATAGTQVVTLLVLVSLALATGTGLPADPAVVATAFACGIVSAVAYLAFYTALRHGPITVVSPVVSMYGGLTVVLSILLLGERLAPTQVLGVAVATSGIVLAAVAFDGGLRRARPVGPGVAYALVALVAFAAVTVILSGPIRAAGWLPVLLVARIANAGTVCAILGTTRLRRRSGPATLPARSLDRRVAGLVLAAGLLDVAGFIAFAVGLQVSETWLVGITSSFGPVVAVAVGVLVFGERPRSVQWLGLAFVLASVFLIALG
jgi:drug/metabolite transporter (DMT)-like permease